MEDSEFRIFLVYFNKSSQIPKDLTVERIHVFYEEVLAYISAPDYEHASYLKLCREKIIKIGIVNCWLRENLFQRGYELSFILKLTKTSGKEMFFTTSPIWKVATEYLEKHP